ncbi:MAG: hypothetical protein Q7J12_02830 [Syntrophales bacterium]|nr:hypothetical protein [Syntrophales bacterium]
MKKLILLFIVVFSFIPPGVSDASYLIRLKNGGELITPLYWLEGNQIFFFYGSGIAGIERIVVDRVEMSEKKPADYMDTISENRGNKELPPLSSATEKSPGPDKPPAANIPEEKVNIADYKNKKDRLTVELEDLLNKRREAGQRKDKEAKEKLTEEITKTSSEIYGITDEVTAKNKGKLPEGWWVK